MTRKSKKDIPVVNQDRKLEQAVDKRDFVLQYKGANRESAVARSAMDPAISAAATIQRVSRTFGELHLMGLVEELGVQASHACAGRSQRSEAILIAQAHTLDTLFNELVKRSASNMGQCSQAADQYMRLALKAQSQCRTTLETLSEIQNPRSIAFVRQANIAQNQQVNNLAPRAGGKGNTPNELLEADNGKRLDTGATGKAGAADQQLEAVGAINRTEEPSR